MFYRLPVHFQNGVARTQARRPRRSRQTIRIRLRHPADGRGVVSLVAGLAHLPDNDGKHHRQQKTEERSGERHDDFVERRDIRQRFRFFIRLAFDGFHRGHLRQRDVAAGGNPAEGVFDVADFLLPDGLAEPDGEAVHLQTAPLGGEEMAQLVNTDEQVEQQHHFQRHEDVS